MGAADYPFGYGFWGADPVIPPGSPRQVTPPVALRHTRDGRDFELDANGFYREIHPVDQKVALALVIVEGSLSSVPEMGNRLRTINRVSQAKGRTLAEQYVRLALSDLLKNGDVSIVKVEVDNAIKGRLVVAVTYKNLRVNPPTQTTTQIGFE